MRFLLGFLLGAFLVYRFFPRVQPLVQRITGVLTAGDPSVTFHTSDPELATEPYEP